MRNKNIKWGILFCLLAAGFLLLSLLILGASVEILLFCAGFAGFASILYLLSVWQSNRKIDQLCMYLRRIANGQYDLDIRDNEEGSLSKLKNDLYKLTVQLREQAELLKKDKKYLADALADISHQLKTPLTSMMVMAELLEDPTLPEHERQTFLSEINRSLAKTQWLIESLLKMARLDADAVLFAEEQVSAAALIDAAVSPLTIRAELKDVTIKTIGQADALLCCDKSWTAEAITNLIKNCVEHTPSGGTVTVSCTNNPLHFELCITDTGNGFTPEDLPHIFERFYRGKDAKSDSVGIGLALSKAILNRQNAELSAQNVDSGAPFTVRFYKLIL